MNYVLHDLRKITLYKVRIKGLIFTLMLFSVHAFAQEYATAFNKHPLENQQTDRESLKPLNEILNSLSKQYKVKFAINDKIIENKYAQIELLKNKDLNEALIAILEPNKLKFKKVDEYYVIQPIADEQGGLDKIEKKSLMDYPETNSDLSTDPLSSSSIDAVPSAIQRRDFALAGKVTGSKGEVLPGVTVVVKGTTIGTVTDANGNFKINVPDNATTLVFSFVGYISEEVAINNQTTLNVSLIEDIAALQEVVVVGYGTQKKEDITGAIASINSNAIARSATPDPAGALQGQVPGVVVVKNPGKPGSGYSINIRGTSSIGGSNAPLYVIDGIPSNSGLNELNPADIEKIDVLKDASATAIYGSRGAKGVVIVTTKRGKAGKTMISYDAYVGVRKPTHLPEMFNSSEYVAYRTEMFTAQGKDISRNNAAFFTPEQWKNIDEGRSTDWPSLVLENALQMNHNITASGGDDKTRFSIGAGLLQEDGNIKPEAFKRYSFRGSVERQINSKWKSGMNLYMTQNLQNIGSSESLRSAYRLPPMTNPYDSTGAKAFRVYGTNAVTSPFFDQENEIRERRSFRTFGNIFVQVEPIAHLILKSTISPSYSASRTGTYFGPLTKQSLGGAVPTQANNTSDEQLIWVLDNQAIYEAQLDEHKLTATIVQSVQQDRYESSTFTVDGLPYKSLWYNLSTASKATGYGSNFTQTTLVSFMGRINYSYKDRYLLTATGRWDGSSRLAEGNKWGFFPSASVAWRISNERFLENISAINDLKLRLSYGETGNDRVDPYSTQATLGQTFYDFGGTIAPGYAPNQLPNKNLTWETTREVNVGLDFSFIKNRIFGSVDLYNRKIDNILLSRQLPPQSGWNSITDNIGKLRNSGIEVGLSTINVQAGKFSWKSDFVYDANKNEILELSNGKNDDIGSRLFIGQPVQVNYDYVFDGIWQLEQESEAAKYNQKPGQIRVRDIDNDGVINANDRQIIGKRIPTWTGSFSNTFKYGNLDFFVMIYTRRGEQFNSSFDATLMNYNQDYNQVKVDYWTTQNPSQTHFQPGNPGPYSSIANYRKVDFTRVGNITLGYNLPAGFLQKYKISSFRIYGTATNPFLFTKYEGFDPEWPSQNTYGTAISSSSYLFGINLSI